MTPTLPSTPNLEQQHKRAKTLLKQQDDSTSHPVKIFRIHRCKSILQFLPVISFQQ
jgi:hypothetical protein